LEGHGRKRYAGERGARLRAILLMYFQGHATMLSLWRSEYEKLRRHDLAWLMAADAFRHAHVMYTSCLPQILSSCHHSLY